MKALVQTQGCISDRRKYTALYRLALGLKFLSIHVFHMYVRYVGLCAQHEHGEKSLLSAAEPQGSCETGDLQDSCRV